MAVDPKEKGCVPFGGERVASKSEDIQRSGVGLDLKVVSIVMICAVASFSTIFNNHLPALGEFGGIAIVAPAILLSINMFGNMSFKIGFGALNDYLGAKRTTLLGFLVLLCACFMLLFGGDLLVCMAAFMFGVNSFISTAQAPLIAKDMWTKSQYPVALQIVQIATRLFYAVFSYVEGALFDMWGSYTPLLCLQVLDVVVGVSFVLLVYAWRKRHA
jgi:MFS family permease